MSLRFEFSMIPLDRGESASACVARSLDIVRETESLAETKPHLLRRYLEKMRGGGKPLYSVAAGEIFWSWLGAFAGMGLVGFLDASVFMPANQMLLIGSFGASAVLVYGIPSSPLAQPRNLLGGHLLSAVVGVALFQWLGGIPWLAAALAVSLAIAGMHLTHTLHPPGGATALIAVIGSEQVHHLGFLYVLAPIGLGALSLLLVALLVNNLAPSRCYPTTWW